MTRQTGSEGFICRVSRKVDWGGCSTLQYRSADAASPPSAGPALAGRLSAALVRLLKRPRESGTIGDNPEKAKVLSLPGPDGIAPGEQQGGRPAELPSKTGESAIGPLFLRVNPDTIACRLALLSGLKVDDSVVGPTIGCVRACGAGGSGSSKPIGLRCRPGVLPAHGACFNAPGRGRLP